MGYPGLPLREEAGRAVLPTIERLEHFGEIELEPSVREKLLSISASIADRLLAGERSKFELKSRSRTRPGSLLKHQIPIRTFSDWDDAAPGFLVAHVAHVPPHRRVVLLLHEAGVVLAVGPGPREGDLLGLAKPCKLVVDELAPVVGVDAEKRERQGLGYVLQRSEYPFLGLVLDRADFPPVQPVATPVASRLWQ